MLVVALDLRRTVEDQDERFAAANQREAARLADELRRHFLDPATLELVPAVARFEVVDGALVIPEDVGWLDSPRRFDPERDLDVVVRDRLARARGLEGQVAREAWSGLVDDPGVAPAASQWLVAQAAWAAHRRGDGEERDARLLQVDPAVSAEAGLSALLLLARLDRPLPAWAMDALCDVDESRMQAVLSRLAQTATVVPHLRLGTVEKRRRLRNARRWLRTLAAGEAQVARSVEDGLLLYSRDGGRGAVLDDDEIEALAKALCPELATGLAVLMTERYPGAIPVVPGAVWVYPFEIAGIGWFSGPTGLALLAIALALLCGGGTFLALRASRREAQATALRAEFLTTVTHELKTPLAGIRLLTEMLAEGRVADAETRHAYLGRLSGEAVRLSMLIENVLDLGRIERGESVHDPRVVDIAAALRDTVALFAPLAERDGLRVELDTPQSEVWAQVDADAVRQALLNVCDNARKYASDSESIEVALVVEGQSCVVRVRDFGPGVGEEERELVFERFRRGVSHRHGGIPGVGLGLHLARAIARRHGGDLRCVAPPDARGGACFELSLPVRHSLVEEEPAA